MTSLREFMNEQFLHFNAREVLEAAKAYEAHVGAGGRMLVSMAGAMSTGELGISLAPLIRAGKVHAISCTGANLEEDVFNLLAHDEYERVPQWRALSQEDEKTLFQRGMNRVTDTCIPEDVMRTVEARLLRLWTSAAERDERRFPFEFVYQLLDDPGLPSLFQIDPANSWVLAAKEANIPVYAPGWEDSTMGNIFAANVKLGRLPSHQCVKTGTEQFHHLLDWYLENNGLDEGTPSVGFFQIGGGIAGDFAICAVPSIIQDLGEGTPFWGYFCQITDAEASYGGYSGAVPNEKITWGKLDVTTPRYLIKSDASIVAPLIFTYVLEG
jgi:deoxyhypusine synthase